LHGADYDLRLLRKNHGFVPNRIFDTMLASRLLGEREFGLGDLVKKRLGVVLEKGSQKADWSKRPLTPRMETYARSDTRHLKKLSDILREQLAQKQRLAWLEQSCDRLIAECAIPTEHEPDLVWRIKGSHKLAPAALAVLREIWRWREKEAISANKPPYFVLSHEALVDISAAAIDHHRTFIVGDRTVGHGRQRLCKALAPRAVQECRGAPLQKVPPLDHELPSHLER